MRIGYTTLDDPEECRRLETEGQCEHVAVIREEVYTIDSFLAFLADYSGADIVVTNVENVNLPLIHYDRIAQEVARYECRITFLEKEVADDGVYLDVLSGLAKRDTAMMSRRTHKGLEKAKKKGKIGGRPTISPETIDRIQFLYYSQQKNIREISTICGVSLGTVHKYKNEASERYPTRY